MKTWIKIAAIGCGGLVVVIAGCTWACSAVMHQKVRTDLVATQTAFVPDPTLKSLVSDLQASRDGNGGTVLTANVALPDGTEILVGFGPAGSQRTFGQSKVRVLKGKIRTASFKNGNASWTPGTYQASLFARFEPGWQDATVLSGTGANGIRLSKLALQPQDPDLPPSKQDRWQMDYKLKVVLPEFTEDQKAIEQVKAARLSLPDKTPHRSADPVGGVIKLFTEAPGTTIQGWSAIKQGDGSWLVRLAFLDGTTPDEAQWSYNPVNGEVKYLNRQAKIFSWSPNY